MRLLIAGGGTGGHLFPGLALAEEVMRRDRAAEVLFVGTARGLEAEVVPREGFRLELIEQTGLKNVGALGAVRGLARLPRALWQARRIVRRFRPDVTVGVGGYSSGPVVLAAALLGTPTAVLEQNAVPGFTNRVLARFVDAVLVNFDASAAHFPARKVRVIGNPVRRAVAEADRGAAGAPAPARRKGEGEVRLLVLGGSQGARALNENVPAAVAALPEALRARVRVRHQSGKAEEEKVRDAYATLGLAAQASVEPFIRAMATAYATADLLVCRAGATTLAELTAAARPSILVPFPHAADDHQTANARAVADAGGAVLLPQSALTPARLAAELSSLLDDPDRLAAMGAAARTLARPDAAALAADTLAALVRS
ncbi:MAG TPA: undecaprenyldiphospho-muramoylpentapeptide beta-N-acetylglucosaminyltransferase [Myxococcota bacterium]|nr:undecaprenyldiphospho-muramoylpentapeptide beta-N-acetylglucosaminyltransferase [Myxococcota bacterium]